MKNRTYPETAFHFDACRPEITAFAADGADSTQQGKRKFGGVAYSGKPLRHPYWGVVAFDLSSTEAPDPVPVLVEHDRDKRAGFATLSIGDNIQIQDGTLLDTEQGQAIAAESDAGFPWQMSVHIEPGAIEEVKAGAKAQVNGHTVQGPAYVFRQNLIREVSFTPTGVDHNTSATALSAGIAPINKSVEEHDMSEKDQTTIESLKASLEAAEERAKAAEARAEEAEKAVEAMRREQRMSAVKELFGELGREFSEEAAKPYLEMTNEMFAAVAADMKAAKPKLPETLFSAEATDGAEPDAGKLEALINA